ncbi:hypothetical protein C8R44DRAFT_916008 [Mycena epipterygia]|nr:hypothetical protein C8R44DRAFT_916008 [Mycena epipterygia]
MITFRRYPVARKCLPGYGLDSLGNGRVRGQAILATGCHILGWGLPVHGRHGRIRSSAPEAKAEEKKFATTRAEIVRKVLNENNTGRIRAAVKRCGGAEGGRDSNSVSTGDLTIDPVHDLLSTLMHNALRFENVSKLPSALQTLALAAARGSLNDILDMHTQIAVRAPTDPELQLLLPVLYTVLHPSGIPNADRLENMLLAGNTDAKFDFLDVIDCAFSCLISIAGIPAAATLDLWRRIWPWFQFIDAHREVIPGAHNSPSCIEFILLLASLKTSERITPSFQATPGVQAVIARAWRESLGINGPTVLPMVLQALFSLICYEPNIFDPASITEYLDGVGGARELASLVLHHINHFSLSKAVSSVSFLNIGLVFAMTALVNESDSWLTVALLTEGLVGAVCNAFCTLSGITDRLSTRAMGHCMLILNKTFFTHPRYQHMTDALRCGFLRGLVAYTTFPDPQIAFEGVKAFLTGVLPPYTIFYSILTQLRPALLDVAELVAAEVFVTSPIYESWTEFVEVVTTRLAVMEQFDSEEYEAALACDNILCGEIYLRNGFRRCSNCQGVYYCSAECQTVHWQEGGHRAVCHSLRSLRLSEPYSTRDRWFMRELLDSDYKKGEANTLVARATTEHPVKIWFYPLPAQNADDPQLPYFIDYVSQALKSRGGKERTRIIPLRSNRSRIHNGLQRIMSELPRESRLNGRLTMSAIEEIRMLAREREDEEDQVH